MRSKVHAALTVMREQRSMRTHVIETSARTTCHMHNDEHESPYDCPKPRCDRSLGCIYTVVFSTASVGRRCHVRYSEGGEPNSMRLC
mmetsp:Transcript_20149/g.46228  ORF Transcript_20149/g.46228 Transcript_20149/m.46228 type:complete len:87 (+) Transcript_20149:187-447(+)